MDSLRSLCAAVVALTLLGACAPAAAPAAAPPAERGAAPAPPAAPAAARPEAAPAGEGRAAAPAPAAVAPLSPPVRVRIGGLLTLALAPIYVAESRGYFAEEGLEVEYTLFDSGARMVAPLAAG